MILPRSNVLSSSPAETVEKNHFMRRFLRFRYSPNDRRERLLIGDEVLQVSEQCDTSVVPVMRVGDSGYSTTEKQKFGSEEP